MNKELLKKEFWRQHVEQCQKAETSQAAYCREHGLVIHQFGYWHRKLSAKPRSSWLPVEIKPTPTSATIDLMLGDRTLRIEEGFDAALLKQIIVAVEAIR